MKSLHKTRFLSTLAVLSTFLFCTQSRLSFADESTSSDPQMEHSKKGRKMAFKVGVCVGQTLADEGIMLPTPEAGKKPKVDHETKKAFKKALKECIKELKPTHSDEDEDESVLADTILEE